jgi:methylase of polypeptide subunit release factors
MAASAGCALLRLSIEYPPGDDDRARRRVHLIVPPTVFHPRFFLTSEFFADFISRLDLLGKRVLDVGTGTGILALAAARAGALSASHSI